MKNLKYYENIMKKGIKHLAVLCSVVFLLTILIPTQLFADSPQPTINSVTDNLGNIVTSSFAKESQVTTPCPTVYCGDELIFTINASGSGKLLYKFDYRQGGGESIIIQDWSTSNTCTWIVPEEARGDCFIELQVKNDDGLNFLSFKVGKDCDDYTNLSYYVQADKIQLISVTPPKGTILQRGTEVPFEVKVNYKLESQPSGFIDVGLQESLSNIKGVVSKGIPIGQVNVSQGSGTVVISGLVNVEDLYDLVETDTVYLQIILFYQVSEEETGGLDYECITEYPYYIEGEAPPENKRPAVSFFEKNLKAGFIASVPELPPVVTALAQITVIYEQDEQIEDKFWVREINYQYDGDYWGSSRISIVSSGVRLWSVTIGTAYKQDVFYPNVTVYATDKIELYTAGIPGPSLWDLLEIIDPNPLSLFLRFAPSNAFNSVTFDPLDKPKDFKYWEDYYSPYIEQADAEAIQIASPGELRVYDSQGNVTGVVEGNIETEIPNSLYIENSIIIFFAEDSYTYTVYGMDDAEYDINAASIKEGKSMLVSFADIPIISGAVHQYTVDWDALSRAEKGITVKIDADGDGAFEKTFTTDSELTHDEFVSKTEGLSFWIWIAGGAGITLILVISCILIKRRLARSKA